MLGNTVLKRVLTQEELKERFRNRVTSLDFLRLPQTQQQNEIDQTLASGPISLDSWNLILSQLERNLRVVSLNVGYNIMSNSRAGNEAAFVERCQRSYPSKIRNGPDLSGWFFNNGNDRLSSCTNNSAMFLLDYNLFGLQEVNPNFEREFTQQIRTQGQKIGKDFEFLDNNYPEILPNNTLITGYDRNVMGQGILITPRDYGFGREEAIGVLQSTYFPKRNLLFINIHAPIHSINLSFRLSIAFERIEQNLPNIWPIGDPRNLRILVVGNFHDCEGLLINDSRDGQFKIFGKELRLHVYPVQTEKSLFGLGTVGRTCCYPNYRCHGDYIFDSVPFPTSKLYYFGLPIDYNRQIHLYSDHDPVVMLELDDFRNKTIQGEISRKDEEDERIEIIFKNLDQDMLYDTARLFLRRRGISDPITKPLSWHFGFPHVSLNEDTYPSLRKRIGDEVNVTLRDLILWQDRGSQWVAITVTLPAGLLCPRTCHISIGQYRALVNRR